MRTEVITREEFDRAKSRALSMDFDADFNGRDFGYQLSLLEVPGLIATMSMISFKHSQGVDLTLYPNHDDDALFDHVEGLHKDFLVNGTEEAKRLCFVKKALLSSETETDDEKWESDFSAQLEKEFGVPADLGVEAMRESPSHRNRKWTDVVAETALVKITEHLDAAPVPGRSAPV